MSKKGPTYKSRGAPLSLARLSFLMVAIQRARLTIQPARVITRSTRKCSPISQPSVRKRPGIVIDVAATGPTSRKNPAVRPPGSPHGDQASGKRDNPRTKPTTRLERAPSLVGDCLTSVSEPGPSKFLAGACYPLNVRMIFGFTPAGQRVRQLSIASLSASPRELLPTTAPIAQCSPLFQTATAPSPTTSLETKIFALPLHLECQRASAFCSASFFE
jgi:hypothetical protein